MFTKTNPGSEIVSEVNKTIRDFANSNANLRDMLNKLTVKEVREFAIKREGKATTRALLVYLPYPFHKNQSEAVMRLMQELTKKLNALVFMSAKRTMIHNRSAYKQKIPRSRTLTAVYESLLDDLIAPADILGKRRRYRLGGAVDWKIQLNEEVRGFLVQRLDAIQEIYLQITKRQLSFEFIQEPQYCMIPIQKKRLNRKKERRDNRNKQEKTA